MVARGRIVPVALILGLAIIIASLTYLTFNHNRQTVPNPPNPPLHQTR